MIAGVSDGGLDLGIAAAEGSNGNGGVAVDDPRKPDVTALLKRHLAFSATETPPEHSFALDVTGLVHPAITFFSYRAAGGQLLGVGALKLLDGESGELKSMHTTAEARGRGVGRAVLAHIIGVARERGLRRIYLETGTTDGFAPARALYASEGFVSCGTFGGYPVTGDNTFMTLALA
jgi:putative acetyltransferase